MTKTCTVEHYRDPERPRRTADGYAICGGCTVGLKRDIAALPKLYEDLVYLHGARRKGGESGKVSGSTTARLPIALSVADARADLHDTVISWAYFAHHEARSVGPITDTVASASRWLSVNVEWSARQEWAPDLVTAIRRIRSRAVRLLDPKPRQQFAIPGADGQCVREVDGAPCPGRLWVMIPTGEEESSLVECNECCHGYPPMSWLRLGKLVHARRVAA